MQILAPDILSDARGLSGGIAVTGLVVGLFLWLLGGQAHRFWVVLAITLAAGVLGLYSGPAYGVQPMVAGLLAAVAAGVMALALARVLAFGAGGVTAWVLVRSVAPNWDDPLVTFLVGGLVGLVLFRFWMMVVTSTAGAVVVSYSTLCLADRLGHVDSVSWADQHAVGLNWACGLLAVCGLLVQFVLDRRRAAKKAAA